MNKSVFIISLASFLFTSGCSTIINGDTHKMIVSAEPYESEIILKSSDGVMLAESTGSMNYNLDKGDGYFDGADYKLEVSHAGYETQVITLSSTLDGWYVAGNFLFGGLIGWLIVDPATGAMWTIEADQGHDAENIRVILRQDATNEMMNQAVSILPIQVEINNYQ